jgi:hypothetical protein
MLQTWKETMGEQPGSTEDLEAEQREEETMGMNRGNATAFSQTNAMGSNQRKDAFKCEVCNQLELETTER